MIYVIVNIETGELLQISENPLTVSGSPLLVKTIQNISYPVDLTEYEWSNNSITFIKKDKSRIYTKVKYLRLFTPAERIAIRNLSKVNEEIADYIQLMELSEEINLDDPELLPALQLMEAGGILQAGRAVEIFSG